MAKQRYVNTKFWDDNYVIELDPIEKLLFLYFMTNPLTNIAGIYEISLKRISFDTGIDKEMVLKIISRFSKEKKIYYYENHIIICNFPKHQECEKKPKIKTGIEIILNSLSDSLKKYTLSIPYQYPLNYSNLNLNSNNNTNSNTKEDTAKSGLHAEIIKLLFTNYKSLYSSDMKFTAKEGAQVKKIVALVEKEDKPLDIVKFKIKMLKHRCKKDDNFWTMTPGILLSKWNELVDNDSTGVA